MSNNPSAHQRGAGDPYHIPDIDEDSNNSQTPRQHHLHLLHSRQLSLGDPISISVQSPSTANLTPAPSPFPVPDHRSASPIPESQTADSLTTVFPAQTNTQQDRIDVRAERQLPPRPSIEDASSTSSHHRARADLSGPPGLPVDAPAIRRPFTAVDPFARRKHRLSWTSILSVKDKRHSRKVNPPDAWTTPLEDTDNLDGVDALSTDVVYDKSSLDNKALPSQVSANPGHDGQLNPDVHSLHQSTSSNASYHSAEPEKLKKTATFQSATPSVPSRYNALPYGQFSRQPTETIPEGLYYPSPEPEPISILGFISQYLPGRMYLYFLLGVPGLYFSRVATVFEDANIQGKALEQMVLANVSAKKHPELIVPYDHPAFKRLTKSWTQFIDTLIREWKTFNIISVLLLSAIVAILQIEQAFKDPIVHYAALFSLVSALMSLLFGCMYILRFNTMRLPHKAVQWAQETQKEHTNLFWNVWILLAIPAVWLVWSLLFYILCIMAFVWRVENGEPPPAFSDNLVLTIRIGISTALGVGIIYIIVVLRTFINFGAAMDARFKRKLEEHLQKQFSSGAMNLKRSDTVTSRQPVSKDFVPDWVHSFPGYDAGRLSSPSLHQMNAASNASLVEDFAPIVPMVEPKPVQQQRQREVVEPHVRFKPSRDNIVAPSPPALPLPHFPMRTASHNSYSLGRTSIPIPIPSPVHVHPVPRPQPARRVLQRPKKAMTTPSSVGVFENMRGMEEANPGDTANGLLGTSSPPTTMTATTTASSSLVGSTRVSTAPTPLTTPPLVLTTSPEDIEFPTGPPKGGGGLEERRAGPPVPPLVLPLKTKRPRLTVPGAWPSNKGSKTQGGSDASPLVLGPTSKAPYDTLLVDSPHKVVCNGVAYPTAARAYDALRKPGRSGPTGGTDGARTLVDVLKLKFEQNRDAARVLAGTGDKEIVYPTDWDGDRGEANVAGRALMEVRRRLKASGDGG